MSATSERPPTPERKLARFLGWFSLALGVPQLLMPGRVNRLIGVKDDDESRLWQRIVGGRELVAAAGILGLRRPVAFLWARVVGDVKDLVLLGRALDGKKDDETRIGAAAASVIGVAALDAVAAVQGTRAPTRMEKDREVRVTAAVTVKRPVEEVYGFWRDFQNLPRFMAHLDSVEPGEHGRSHWRAKAPAGRGVEWDAEVVQDVGNRLIAWRSLEGSTVDNTGTVRFTPAPGDRGTEIRLDMEYVPPAGKAGVAAAKLFGEEPKQQVNDDLRRLKQVMETGDVVRSEGSPEGALSARQIEQRPAQPPAEPVGAEGSTS